ERVGFRYFIDKKQLGARVLFEVWREGKAVKVTAICRRIARLDRLRSNAEAPPPYVVHAGLLFTALRGDYLRTLAPKTPHELSNYRYLTYELYYRPEEHPERSNDETIVLARVFRDPVNAAMAWVGPTAVKSINGRPIRSIADVNVALVEGHGRYHVFE